MLGVLVDPPVVDLPDGHRIQEVHADDQFGPPGKMCQLAQTERGGVGHEDRISLADRAKRLDELALELEILVHGFDDDFTFTQFFKRCRVCHTGKDRPLFRGGLRPAFDFVVERPVQSVNARSKCDVVFLDTNDVDAGVGNCLDNSLAHHSKSDDTDRLKSDFSFGREQG